MLSDVPRRVLSFFCKPGPEWSFFFSELCGRTIAGAAHVQNTGVGLGNHQSSRVSWAGQHRCSNWARLYTRCHWRPSQSLRRRNYVMGIWRRARAFAFGWGGIDFSLFFSFIILFVLRNCCRLCPSDLPALSGSLQLLLAAGSLIVVRMKARKNSELETAAVNLLYFIFNQFTILLQFNLFYLVGEYWSKRGKAGFGLLRTWNSYSDSWVMHEAWDTWTHTCVFREIEKFVFCISETAWIGSKSVTDGFSTFC